MKNSGINTILKSLPLKEGDEIFVYTYTYAAIRNAAESAAFRSGPNSFLFFVFYTYANNR